jgi:hypothetical protein
MSEQHDADRQVAPDRDHFDRLIRQYGEGEKEAYDSATALLNHTDQMLTWLLGLMGAGLIAGVPLLKTAPPCARLAAVFPWLLGIVAALGGRVIAARLRNKESLWHFDMAIRIRALLVRPDLAKATLELQRIINRDDPELACRHEWVSRNGRALGSWYYATLALFGVGMITIVAIATAWPVQ